MFIHLSKKALIFLFQLWMGVLLLVVVSLSCKNEIKSPTTLAANSLSNKAPDNRSDLNENANYLNEIKLFDEQDATVTLNELCTYELAPNQQQLNIFFILDPECPYVEKYSERIKDFFLSYHAMSKGNSRLWLYVVVPFKRYLMIYSNEHQALKKEFKLIPFYYDQFDSMKLAFKMKVSPSVLAINQKGSVLYQGMIDDNWFDKSFVKKDYLKNLMESYLGNEKFYNFKETLPFGCDIVK